MISLSFLLGERGVVGSLSLVGASFFASLSFTNESSLIETYFFILP